MFIFFFFNDTATTEISTLSLHDALPIYLVLVLVDGRGLALVARADGAQEALAKFDQEVGIDRDRKSTRLNSSHLVISYAVFCLKKKKLAAFNPCADRTHHHDAHAPAQRL